MAALVMTGTALVLFAVPGILISLLLGVEGAAAESLVIASLAGAALLALGIACWIGRRDVWGTSQMGLLMMVLVYDLAAILVLVFAALFLSLAGLALWPVVVLHVALVVWCGIDLRPNANNRDWSGQGLNGRRSGARP